MTFRIPDEKRIEICKLYESLGRIKKVAEITKFNEKTIRNILKEYKIKTTPREERNKKYTIDELFFEEINTHNKAYILGFIYGDGNIVKTHGKSGGGGGVLRFELAIKDEYILYDIRNALKSNAPIKNRNIENRKPAIINNREIKRTESVILNICNTKIYNQLIKIGLTENKTINCTYPNIPDEFQGSFILGLTDSDGWFSIDSKNRGSWNFIGTFDMCEGVRKILLKNDIRSKVIKKSNPIGQQMWLVRITRKDEVIKLRTFVYNNATFYLDRKYNIAKNIQYKSKK